MSVWGCNTLGRSSWALRVALPARRTTKACRPLVLDHAARPACTQPSQPASPASAATEPTAPQPTPTLSATPVATTSQPTTTVPTASEPATAQSAPTLSTATQSTAPQPTTTLAAAARSHQVRYQHTRARRPINCTYPLSPAAVCRELAPPQLLLQHQVPGVHHAGRHHLRHPAGSASSGRRRTGSRRRQPGCHADGSCQHGRARHP